MRSSRSVSALVLLAGMSNANAQYLPPDPSGLQGVIVETYYVSDSADAADTDGSTELVPGATTYRVFVDLKPGYKLLTVGGFTNHPIEFSTTTLFFNNDDRGEAWGDAINDIHLDKNTVAIDSWLSMGAASDAHWGIPKADDPDGSIVGGVNNDGGSNGVSGGLLVNAPPQIGVPLTTSDGLFAPSVPPSITYVGAAPTCFDPGGASSYSDDNFAWAVLGGVQGPDSTNRILIGQFTTDGEFDMCLNFWVRIPDTLVCNDPNCHTILEFYSELVAQDTIQGGYAADNKFTHPTLCFNSSAAQVDCEGVPGGPALPGTPCDDGIAATTNDQYLADCSCAGEDCEGNLGGTALPGTPCDDGDPSTVNDTWSNACTCEGVVGIDETTGGMALSLFPNPVKDQLFVRMTTDNPAPTTLEMRDAVGKQLFSRDLGRVSGERTEVIDMENMRAGLYFVSVTMGGQRRVERITHH